MKASTEIISSNSGKMTPFMKLSWERLFTSSSFWARYHPVIIRFCLCCWKIAFCLWASTQYQHFPTSKWTHPPGFNKNREVYNGADRFVTLLFDEMKIKENLILVEHRELHWFYWFRRHCHKYLELLKEKRFLYTCIGVVSQGWFFKFEVQFIAYLENSQTSMMKFSGK